MEKHGINILHQATSVSSPVIATSGIPFVIGTAPIQSAENPAKLGIPILCTSYNDAVKKFGNSDDWESYTLCEFMASHFQLFGVKPLLLCNVLDPATMKKPVAAVDQNVLDHKLSLPYEAINDEKLVVKAGGGAGTAYIKDTDYTVYYNAGTCIVELLPDGGAYGETAVNIAYDAVDQSMVTSTEIAVGLDAVDKCLSMTGVIPDLICAPGFSHIPAVAAVMAVKVEKICGLYSGKALIDLDCSSTGATEYNQVIALKTQMNVTDKNQIACWPMLKRGNKKYHMSTQLAGLIAQVDNQNGGCPYESPSNKQFQCDGLILADGTETSLTLPEANVLNFGGVLTMLGTLNGLVCWGNYVACYPKNVDVKDYFIPVSRMFDWVGNTLINTFWNRLDKPMNRRLIDSVLDTVNIWLNGLTSSGYLLGGSATFENSENPIEDLTAGIIRIHLRITPPSPAQQIDFVLEYDAGNVSAALTL